MRTKFILHGGYTREENDLNRGYFVEMVRCISDGGNILLVYFASKDEGVKEKYQKDSVRLQSFSEGKTIHTIKATEENFIDEVQNADVIYLRGGDTQKLKNTLDKYPDFIEVVKGKIISGSSAGAYVLARYYFINSLNKVMEGYGCVPARVACHYESKIHPIPENVDLVSEMEKYDNDLELILLKDYEWAVREI
ncbi:hypothetical protein MNBD_CPR01-533 [hydrothermal vent metagenome]|uniref:Peptidase E n=1 Tax=hydrothermal vent metagenome TaxID=652676 RepID=A0A3B0V1R2_9ZZZZ